MPQLDQVTFLSQYFWLLFFFLIFYLIMSNQFIPRIGRILLYRKRKTEGLDKGLSTKKDTEEEKKVKGGYETLLSRAFLTSREEFQGKGDRLLSWLDQKLKDGNQKSYQPTNLKYLTLLGQKESSQEVALGTTSRGVPSSITPPFLFNLLKIPLNTGSKKGGLKSIKESLSFSSTDQDSSLSTSISTSTMKEKENSTKENKGLNNKEGQTTEGGSQKKGKKR